MQTYIRHTNIKVNRVLYVLNKFLASAVAESHYRTQCRRDFLRRLVELAEDGKIAVVESGMDCDGVRYSGEVAIIDATVAAYERHWEHTSKWADGPFTFALMRPSEAKTVQYESRDLGAEAFEDGHAHIIYN